jgi:hypothetical protein
LDYEGVCRYSQIIRSVINKIAQIFGNSHGEARSFVNCHTFSPQNLMFLPLFIIISRHKSGVNSKIDFFNFYGYTDINLMSICFKKVMLLNPNDKFTPPDCTRFTMRINTETLEKIRKIADEKKRSVAKQIEFILEWWLSSHEE